MAPALMLLFAPGLTPQATLQAFIDAFNQRDFAAAARLVVGGKEEGEWVRMLKTAPIGPNTWPKISYVLEEMRETGDEATAVTVVTTTGAHLPPGSRNQTVRETVNLRRVEGDWKIIPARLGNGGPTQPFFGSFSAMLTDDDTVFRQAKQAALRTARLSNLKQLALAMVLHQADHNDKFLLDDANLRRGISPYLRDEKLFLDPETQKAMPLRINPRLVGKRATDVLNPAETVMLTLGSRGNLWFDASGKTPVAFVDSHVKYFDRAAAARLRWEP